MEDIIVVDGVLASYYPSTKHPKFHMILMLFIFIWFYCYLYSYDSNTIFIVFEIYLVNVGAYVPLTMEGNIVVDGVLASCYPSADHDVAHIGMTPMRWFPGMVEWLFGNIEGMQVYVSLGEELGGWFLPKSVTFWLICKGYSTFFWKYV